MKFRINDISILFLLLCMILTITHIADAKRLEVNWKDGLLSVDVEDVYAVDVLKKIEEVTHINIEVGEGIEKRIKTFKAKERTFKGLMEKMFGGEGFGVIIEYKGNKIQKVKIAKKKGQSSIKLKDVSYKKKLNNKVKKELEGHIATIERLKHPKNEKEQGEVFSSFRKIIAMGKIGLHFLKAYFRDKSKNSMMRSIIGELMLSDELKDENTMESMAEVLKDKSQNEMVRGRSGFYMGLSGNPEAAKYLVPVLNDKNEKESVRAYATAGLMAMAVDKVPLDDKAVDALIEALKDPYSVIRTRASDALGHTGNARAVEPLIELSNSNLRDTYRAVIALGRIGDKRAVPHLLERYQRDEKNRGLIIESLGKIRDKRVVPFLIEELKNQSDGYYQYRIAEAMMEIGDPRAAIPLKETYKRATDKTAKEKIKESYKKLTGEELNED